MVGTRLQLPRQLKPGHSSQLAIRPGGGRLRWHGAACMGTESRDGPKLRAEKTIDAAWTSCTCAAYQHVVPGITRYKQQNN